jgi:predicted aspartyl protease
LLGSEEMGILVDMSGWDYAKQNRGPLVGLLCVWGLLVAGPCGGRARAAGRPTVADSLANCGYIKVKVKVGRENHLLLAGKANGQELSCVIDTGCVGSVLGTEAALPVKQVGVRKGPVYGPLGTIGENVPLVAIDQFEAGGVVESNLPAALLPLLKQGRRRWDEKRDMILGLDFLKRQHALVSYDGASCVYLRREASPRDLAATVKATLFAHGFVAVPIKSVENSPQFIEGLVCGKSAWFILDTGASRTQMDRVLLAGYGIASRQVIGAMQDLSGGQDHVNLVKLPSLRIGEFELTNFKIGAVRMPILTKGGRGRPGTGQTLLGFIGPDILTEGRAVIDCAGGMLYLKPKGK